MMEKSECGVELHSNDFSWEEHAQACNHALFRKGNEEILENDLVKISRERWEKFHLLNKGKSLRKLNLAEWKFLQ